MKLWNKICGISGFFLIISLKSFAQSITLPANNGIKAIENQVPARFYINSISPDYYTKNMGFICKKELNIEKATKIPLRFRLGSLNYVNYLEGKKN